MVLSHDLVSQFVQATKDEPTEVKESVVYGTVQEDTHYVKLDGSDILTPVSTTTVVGAGDRVTVMIKNHTATITGNVSNPSARQIDTLSVDKLDIIYAEIDTLKAADVTVQNKLTANSADIETLKADDVTIKNTLSVHDANIETLLADNVTISGKVTANEAAIQSLISGTATIESLNALKADVNLLTADVANIDTLMFGSASGDVIQTSFANAVIAQLGDAQIKSAMIESISADKITAGDIITNNVRVMSEDGSLIISDETLQISDGARVRVQIGKDASNDYSINIWDQNGNLMFSKGGITDAAIKEAIIRNDMVSDTANIHASKLDIDSLFEEINGSSNTIKSTKVYLDEEGQTLDVAFKSLTTEVTEQGETISSQGTAISTMQGQISSKIWQQDINTAKNEMSTQYSALEQNLTSFKTTVGNTYATSSRVSTLEQTADGLTAKIEGLEIGGRNYIRLNKIASYATYNSVSYDGTTISAKFNTSYTHNDEGGYLTLQIQGYTPPNKVMTLSGYIKVNGVIPSSRYFTTRLCTYSNDVIVDEYDPATGYFVSTQTYNGSSQWIIHGKTSRKSGSADVVTFEKLKFELGNKPTDWTPAPEDVDSDILNASKTATNYLNFSSNGLVIGDHTTSTLGKNVLIDSDSVKIRTGTNVNALFGADIIELAKNNESAVISMLNGTFKIYYSANTSEAGLGIYGKTSTGEERLAFQPVNENDNLTIGWGGYNAGKNSTNIYGHNMKLIAGNDMSIENDRWQINIDGNLFGKASNSSFVELIGLSGDDNTAIGHGGYTAAIGKTNIYGNKIQHIVNTKSGSSSYKPYYEAGDSFETEWYGAGFISSSSKVVYFSIPLAKPIIGNTTPTVNVTDATSSGGLQIRQDSNYVFGSTSSAKVSPSSYSAKVVGDGNFVQIEATMANTTNAVNNAACGINAKIKITFS